jgi:hypothetical protein
VIMRAYRILGCALIALAMAPPAQALDIESNLARAQQTLTEMVRLLDKIEAKSTGAPAEVAWEDLFDGKSLNGWQRTAFARGGAVHVESSFRGGAAILVDAGGALSGFNWTRDVPQTNYEISLETMKIEGQDFMCGLTFPVGQAHASLILGGWGGEVMGISSINNQDASENETTRTMFFPKDRWFAVRLRVTPAKLEAWLDGKKIVDVPITGKKISLRFGEISKSVPIGISTYQTSAAFRSIRLRRIEGASLTAAP